MLLTRPIVIICLGGLVAVGACHSSDTVNSGSSSAGTGGAAAECPPCVKDADCGQGSRCGQFGDDTFCAPDCSQGQTCGAGRACTQVASAEGQPASLCVPTAGPCGIASGSSSTAATSSATGAGGSGMCGSLDGPDVKSCCTSCGKFGSSCTQANGCYGGWWCNRDTCNCQKPPAPASCGPGSTTSTATTSATIASVGAGGSSGIGPTGGKLDTLSFAIVGDTRPPTEDDIAGYPTTVIQKIWLDVDNASPRPAFALATGDYQFSNPYGSGAAKQLDIYVGAKAAFANPLFPAMGNHECTGGTASNCGSGNQNGITNNFTAFLQKMLGPIGQTKPYYSVEVDHSGGMWTSKFVFIAANAWDSTQATWLDAELAKSTTYTFVVRHESTIANQAPGVTPSDAIVAKYPYTVMICGHTHTYEWKSYARQVVVGNGGAPLSGAINYGYVIARQRADGAIEFNEYDYATNAVQATFALKADGAVTK